MQKRLFAVLALLLTSLLLVSCKESAEKKGVDPKVLAATVEKAMKAADALDNMNSKAYEMGQVGLAMAQNGAAGSAQVLDEALNIAREAHSPANKAMVAELKAETGGWEPKDMEQIAPAFDRLEKATGRVWTLRSIAEGIAVSDKGRARSILMEAAAEAEAMADKKYRDLDLRGVAAGLAGMDADAAMGVAGKISDPRVKAYALNAIGTANALYAAGDAADEILKMDPQSALLSEETPETVKTATLGAERSRLQAAAAKSLAATAKALYVIDMDKAKEMFNHAADIADKIDVRHGYTKAYATSDVAIALASVDPGVAGQIVDKIDATHSDARFAALMKIAESNAKMTGKTNESDLEKAEAEAKNIGDSYDEAKALTAVALALVPVSVEKAEAVAKEIEYPEFKNQVYAAIAVAAVRAGDDSFIKAMDKVNEPSKMMKADLLYPKGHLMYIRAKAFCDAADAKAATDPAAAIKLYGKAAGAAADAKSGQLQWKIVGRLSRLDQDKFFEMAAKIESDDAVKAVALADIAADWASRGDAKAGIVWDLAAKAASAVDDNPKSCELLNDIAAKCSQYDKARAAAMFSKAYEKAGKIGKIEG
jgi:hypothetical protein